VTSRPSPTVWPVPAGMLVYSGLKYGVGGMTRDLLPSVLVLAAAYALAVYLYYGIARQAHNRRFYLLWAGFLGALAIGYLLSGRVEGWDLLCDLAMIFGAGLVVGRLAEARAGYRTCYLGGLFVVVLFSLMWIIPRWPQMHAAASAAARDVIAGLQQGASPGLLGGGLAAKYGESLERIFRTFVRLLPASVVMSAVAQYSIGFLWFAEIKQRETGEVSLLKSFVHWGMPRALTLLVLAGVGARVFFGGTAQLAADNVLAALSVFYCLAGLAVVEFYLRRFRIHWGLRLVIYLLLAPTGVAGYLVLALVGFLTGLHDWRPRFASD